MTILITGATGNVAAGAVDRLIDAGLPVRLLVRDRAKAERRFMGRDVEIATADIGDPKALDAAFSAIDTVFVALGSSLAQVDLEKALIDGAAPGWNSAQADASEAAHARECAANRHRPVRFLLR